LLDDVTLKGAKSLLLSITGGPNLTLWEVDEAANRVRKEVDPEANIIVGATFDDALGERVRVSIVASGLGRSARLAQEAPPAAGLEAAKGAAPRAPDFRWRLSQAMTPTEGEAQAGSAWEAPGGVLITEGPPRLGGVEPVERPTEADAGRDRFPGLADFPPHAQRAYRAMLRAGGSGAEPAPPAVYRQSPTDSGLARFGLLRRLADVARGRRDYGAAGPASAPAETGERVDLPAFFGRGKPS
jgi:cell division protein FtsZ